ncbi:unnamed protein product [Paramecium octaurelia]|uniref:Uncharacterized protein n=1 Tax=Paramecium octaurelia TaxID=43137 RepID=A0A8S1XXS0_PAROT|nr:unnamed protein product [Paramecium octaurelia]
MNLGLHCFIEIFFIRMQYLGWFRREQEALNDFSRVCA